MNSLKEYYESYAANRGAQSFNGYGRNSVLDDLFDLPGQVLDIGAGDGTVTEFLCQKGFKGFAMDISETAIKLCQGRGCKLSLVGNAEHPLPFPDQVFTHVFWGDNIEHLFLPEPVLHEINRVLIRNGHLVISLPNMAYINYRVYYALHGMVPRTEGAPLTEIWEWAHIRFFNLATLDRLLTRTGFKIVKVKGPRKNNWIKDLLVRLRPSLFASILVVKARKIG